MLRSLSQARMDEKLGPWRKHVPRSAWHRAPDLWHPGHGNWLITNKQIVRWEIQQLEMPEVRLYYGPFE